MHHVILCKPTVLLSIRASSPFSWCMPLSLEEGLAASLDSQSLAPHSPPAGRHCWLEIVYKSVWEAW